jgi:hypothetical protein
MFQNDAIDKIYEDSGIVSLYTSFLDKKKKQSFRILFGTAQIVPDKTRHEDKNISFDIIAYKISAQMERYTKERKLILIAPIVTFTKAIRNYGLDLRELINTSTIAEIDLIIQNNKLYEIKNYTKL